MPFAQEKNTQNHINQRELVKRIILVRMSIIFKFKLIKLANNTKRY